LAEGEIYAAEAIIKAASEHWQAAAWILERRFPERWGKDRVLLLKLLKQVKELRAECPDATPERSSSTAFRLASSG
jgi:hypothetical protein